MGKGRKLDYRSYEAARDFARALALRNKDEWARFAKGELPGKPAKPKDIPARVDKIYKGHGWQGFDDFLGTRKTKELRKNYRSFEQARAFVRSLRLNADEDWELYLKGKMPDKPALPADVPANPEEIYRDKGWSGMSDWLSDHYQPVMVEYRAFELARDFVRKLKIRSIQEWEAYRNGEEGGRPECPEDIPVWPPHAYKGQGWKNWADWLGLSRR